MADFGGFKPRLKFFKFQLWLVKKWKSKGGSWLRKGGGFEKGRLRGKEGKKGGWRCAKNGEQIKLKIVFKYY